jgi:hypothetical protein
MPDTICLVERRKSDTMQNNRTESGQAMIYQIRIKGLLSDQWSEWFQGLSIIPAGDGDTFLTGPAADQAALFGLLRKVRDLGMPLLSVNRIEGDD